MYIFIIVRYRKVSMLVIFNIPLRTKLAERQRVRSIITTYTNHVSSWFDVASDMQLAPDPQVPAAVQCPSVEKRHLEIHLVEGTLPRAAVAKMSVN